MDKVTPKDVFAANRDRAAPLLAKLRDEGIGHMIDGKTVPSTSGQTFETKSPVDGAVLASVARGNAEDIDRAATAAALAFKSWRDMPAAARKKLLHSVADAIEDRADRHAGGDVPVLLARRVLAVSGLAASISKEAEVFRRANCGLGHEAVGLAGVDAFQHRDVVRVVLDRVGDAMQ